MASLVFAASFLTYNKIKDKRQAKKEAKRQAYEARYNELERAHVQESEKYNVQKQKSGDGRQKTDLLAHHNGNSSAEMARIDTHDLAPSGGGGGGARRSSADSARGSLDSSDGPSAWVEQVLQDRAKREAAMSSTSTR